LETGYVALRTYSSKGTVTEQLYIYSTIVPHKRPKIVRERVQV